MSEDFEDEVVDRMYDEYGYPDSDTTKATYNTMRHDSSTVLLARTFSGRMALYCALTAVMAAVVLSVVLAVVWEGQFQSYTRQNMQRLAQQTADSLAAQYEEVGGWTPEVLSYAATSTGLNADVIAQVIDINGKVIYDETWQMPRSSNGDKAVAPSEADSIVSATILTDKGINVGTVRLWTYGSEALLTKADANFRTSSYAAIIAAAGIAILLACLMGVLASGPLTRPIKVITSTATQIRNGDLTARTNLRGDDEIGRLGETFDSMANELERDIKFERRLTSDVAHELRTPLMAMLCTLEAMQDGVMPTDDEHFETVTGEVKRLSRLVDAMLHLSKIEDGTAPVKFARTDVVYLIKSMVSMQNALFREKGLHLRFDDKTAGHELNADIDPDLIREAVTNLLSNAMRYTSDGGWVVASVERDRSRNEVLISVQDTGMGIAKEDIPKVFSRFWRSDASRERASGGLGVGLSLTKEIVDKHHGAITVESELNKGTIFTLHLPIDQGKKSLVQTLQDK